MVEKGIQQVLEKYTDDWMRLPGVAGTAIVEMQGRLCIKVYVAENCKEIAAKIPTNVEGHRVILQETGEFHLL